MGWNIYIVIDKKNINKSTHVVGTLKQFGSQLRLGLTEDSRTTDSWHKFLIGLKDYQIF